MGWLSIFGETPQRQENRRNKAMASTVWDAQCLWPWTTIENTGQEWVAIGEVDGDDRIRLDHPSAHEALGRYAVVDHLVPKLDKHVLQKMDTEAEVVDRLARMNHAGLWQELARIFSKQQADPMSQETPFHAAWESPWSRILETAGSCGNLAPFRVCPREELVRYLPWDAMPHPLVGLWLLEQKVCTMEDLCAKLNKDTLPMHKDTRYSFAGSFAGEPVSPAYLAQWCSLLLKEYPLPVDIKVRLVAQSIYSFGYDAWKTHVHAVCAPYLQDVNLPLLYAVCGVNTARQGESDSELLQTVVAVSRAPTWNYDAKEAMNWNVGQSVQGSSSHPGLMMLCDLTPAQNRVELYHLACMAQRIDHGLAQGVEMLELPALEQA